MDDLEELLRGYRPAGPPADLRSRVVASATGRRRSAVAEWLAVAATLAFTLLFYWLSAGQQASIAARIGPAAPGERATLATGAPEDLWR